MNIKRILVLYCPQIDWNQTAEALHNWIRGNDKVPGAWAEVQGQVTTLFFFFCFLDTVFPSCTSYSFNLLLIEYNIAESTKHKFIYPIHILN